MYRYMAIANYEDRFVIPTTHREYAEDAFDMRGDCGFVRQRLLGGETKTSLFGGEKKKPSRSSLFLRGARHERAAGPPQGARPPGGERRAAPIGGHVIVTWKALGALLSYPSAELVAALPEIAAILDREPRLDRPMRGALDALIAWLARVDLLDAEENYVALFDRGRATSLHLFEHVHGDSRARGQAMVELQALYAKAGLKPSVNELPDYLPMMLEYLSLREETEVKDMLGDCAHIVRAIGQALVDRDSGYGAVAAAILALVGEPGLSARADKPPPAKRNRSTTNGSTSP